MSINMTKQEQLKALAELDGWVFHSREEGTEEYWSKDGEWNSECPNYLTSYDAIIPLIQKQDAIVNIEDEIVKLNKSCFWYDITPSQLCEALLRATGKWTE